jgi:hypothetical protein
VVDGVTYVIASGGGGRLYLSAPNGGFLHYVASTRTGGGCTFVVYDMKGSVKDRFVINQTANAAVRLPERR